MVKPPRPEHPEMVVLEVYPSEIEAEIAREQLEEAGIASAIVKDDAGGMFPSMQATEGVRLLVPVDEEEKARRILEAPGS